MGEFAEAAIFASQRGKDTADMSMDDWQEFYSEFDANELRAAHREQRLDTRRCPICRRVMKSPKGVRDHMMMVHGKP